MHWALNINSSYLILADELWEDFCEFMVYISPFLLLCSMQSVLEIRKIFTGLMGK